jgi:hypothetical protein
MQYKWAWDTRIASSSEEKLAAKPVQISLTRSVETYHEDVSETPGTTQPLLLDVTNHVNTHVSMNSVTQPTFIKAGVCLRVEFTKICSIFLIDYQQARSRSLAICEAFQSIEMFKCALLDDFTGINCQNHRWYLEALLLLLGLLDLTKRLALSCGELGNGPWLGRSHA